MESANLESGGNSPGSARPGLKGRVFLGWWTVALAGVMHSINSAAYNKGFVVFLLPVSEGLGVGRASIALIFSLSRSEGGPVGPIAGWLIDRFGPKPVLFIGAIMSGGGFLLLARTENVWTFGAVYLGLITLGSDLAFSNALSALVNNWFHRRRALAMSSYHSISSLGPSILVPLLALLIAFQGWRTASFIAGLVILGSVLPLCFLVRSTPESVGLLPDGGPPRPSNAEGRRRRSSDGPQADYPLGDALRTPAYWLLLTGSILRLTAKGGVILNIIPIMVWKGIDEQAAAFIFGFLLFLGVPLSLVFGWLADTLPKNLVLFGSAAAGTLAFPAAGDSRRWVLGGFRLRSAVCDSGDQRFQQLGDLWRLLRAASLRAAAGDYAVGFQPGSAAGAGVRRLVVRPDAGLTLFPSGFSPFSSDLARWPSR